MAKLTITEALAEIKTINSRIIKKREAIMRYFARDTRMRDPLDKDGGSVEFVSRERQAIKDLEERIVAIRSAIQTANLATVLVLGENKRTLAAWLNWRREISEASKAFLNAMAHSINQVRQQAIKASMTMVDKETGAQGEIVVAVNEKALAGEVEAIEQLLGDLNGKLSLLNATTMIEV